VISQALRVRMEALEAIASMDPRIVLRLPLRVVSRGNARWHWARHGEHSARHRRAAHLVCLSRRVELRRLLARGLVVRVVRIAPRSLDTHDNLGTALKPIVDGVADALGLVDDSDERVRFIPDAERGGVREELVRLEFYPRRVR